MLPSRVLSVHRFDEPDDRTLNSLPCGIAAGPTEGFGEFVVVESHLDSSNDEFTVFRFEVRKSCLVALYRLATDRLFKGRRAVRRLVRIDIGRLRLATDPPQLIPNLIENRLAEVRLKCALPACLEHFHSLKRPQQRFLDNIVRVRQIARPAWQPSSRPTPESGQVTG